MHYIVSYDLKNPGQDYQSLINAIKLFNHIYIGGSCWAVKTNLTATQILHTLARYIDTTDNLIVCDFRNWAGCNLTPEVIHWLKH